VMSILLGRENYHVVGRSFFYRSQLSRSGQPMVMYVSGVACPLGCL